jgi:citrate lyase beta subunit
MNQAELSSYLKRAEMRARLADLENAVADDERKAAAEKARKAREDADWQAFVRSVRSRPRPATALRKAELPGANMPVVRVPGNGDGTRVERRMASWYMPGGGNDELR